MNYLIYTLLLYLVPLISYISLVNLYKKTDEVDNKKEHSGLEIARELLDNNNLDKVYVIERKGFLTDCYTNKAVKLSTPVYYGESIYAMLISSYFTIIAMQDNKGNQTIKNKIILDKIFSYIIYAMYIILLVGICLKNDSFIKLSFLLLIISIIYKIIASIIDSTTIKMAIDKLKELEYIDDKNYEEINNLSKKINHINMASIIICLSDLFYKLKDTISNR